MIVPMKKVSLIILGDKKEQALKKLRKLGLVHIEIAEGSGAKLLELKTQTSKLEGAIYTVSEKLDKNVEQKPLKKEECLTLADKIESLIEEKKNLQGEEITLIAELERIKEWGEINPAWFEGLSENGIELLPYELPISEYERINESVQNLVFAKTKYNVKALLIRSNAEGEQEILDTVKNYKFELPKKSTKDLTAELYYVRARVQNIDSEIASYACYANAMKDAVKLIEKEIQFEVYSTGMNEARLSEKENGVSVAYFKGYIEAERLSELQDVAKENSWGLLAEDPTEEDDVPTKLKNNKFVSLIYPLTDFLGTVPGYFEYDISAWFLGFILIFFGIIFGDGGYGLLITAIALVPILMALIKKKPVQPAFLLFLLFGLSTVVWGALTCTWFGLSPEMLPNWLKSLSIPFISNVYADKLWQPFWVSGEVGLTTSQNLQIFCFSLALIQLTVAHVKNAIRNRKSIKVLADIGDILKLIGIYYVVLSLVVNGAVFTLDLTVAGIPVGFTAIAFVGVGFVLSFVFANYEGSVGKAIVASLKDIVSVLLGVINVFSDIVSYIRLWAVGLAGAAISTTVNDLVSPFLGNFMLIIVALVLLVFGHGLNMILNVLSVIVHGIRLNTLEFSSHLNMSWSGHKYEPFKE